MNSTSDAITSVELVSLVENPLLPPCLLLSLESYISILLGRSPVMKTEDPNSGIAYSTIISLLMVVEIWAHGNHREGR